MKNGLAFIKTHHSYHEASGHTAQYVSYAKERNINKLVMIDRCSLADMITFYDKCKQADIEPIMGATLRLADPDRVWLIHKEKNAALFASLHTFLESVLGRTISDQEMIEKLEPLEQRIIKKVERISKEKKADKASKDTDELMLSLLELFDAPSLVIEHLRKIKGKLPLFKTMSFLHDGTETAEEYVARHHLKGFVARDFKTLNSYRAVSSPFLAQFFDGKSLDTDFFTKALEFLKKPMETYEDTVRRLGCKKLVRKELLFLNDLKANYENLYDFLSFLKEDDETVVEAMERLGCTVIDKEKLISVSVDKEEQQSFLQSLVSNKEIESKFKTFFQESCHFVAISEDCYSDLVVVAGDQNGFEAVKELISWSYREGQHTSLVHIKNKKRCVFSYPKTLIDRLKQKTDNLFCILGGYDDELGKAIHLGGDPDEAIEYYKSLFGERIVIAVQRSSIKLDGSYHQKKEDEFNAKLLELSVKHSIPAIAMNNALFLNEEDYEVHDAKEAILLDEKVSSVSRDKTFRHGHYLRNWDDIKNDFSDLPELVHNAESFTKLFDKVLGEDRLQLHIELDQPVLPEFPIPQGDTPTSYMRKMAEEGVESHLSNKLIKMFGTSLVEEMTEEQREQVETLKVEYQERLDYEIGIIDDMGFPGYFLIVSDFIVWAKENGVPVGPGRGSGAGSLVAYALKITNVDPIEHGLLFERFLNPERVSMPDFDVDFGAGFHPVTGEYKTRDSVIAYTADKYNKEDAEFPSVAQIATHGLMAAKSATKAIAKAKYMSVRFGEDLTGEFPDELEVKMKHCLEEECIIHRMENEPITRDLLVLSAASEGLKKSSGVHAGGVVIAPDSLTKFTPVQSDIRDLSKLIAQLDKGDVERGGLVKFDFLGLANLTTMSFALKNIEETTGKRINLDSIPMDDKAVFKLLQSANSHGVFQVESSGMRDLLRRVHVENMEELSALLALFRPGPLQSGMVDNFIDRKHGREEVSYPDSKYQHECLVPILEPTYGIILYQEQVMQIAQALAGYTLGGADMLRRAMGKKKPEEMAKQRAFFEAGAIKNGIDGDLAMKIFDLVEKFAGYGFNKSHSMAYAFVSYQTAYLKTYYICEYMAAVLSSQMDDMDKLKVTIVDCQKNGIEILPPHINKSSSMFKPEGDMKIRFGLGAIHGVGSTKLEKILAERENNGDFTSIPEIVERCRSAFDATVAESMIMSGAMDELDTFFALKEGALRHIDEAKPASSVSEYISQLKEKEKRLEVLNSSLSTTKEEGVELRRIIESLCARYVAKYALIVPERTDLNGCLELLWAFFIKRLDRYGNFVGGQTESGFNVLRADFDALKFEVAQRSVRANQYRQYLEALKSTEQSIENAKAMVVKAEQADAEAEKAWRESLRESVAFDKRAFFHAEALYMANFKAKDLNASTVDELMADFEYGETKAYSDKDRLSAEMSLISYYVTGHPLDVNNLRMNLKMRGEYVDIGMLKPPVLDPVTEEPLKILSYRTAGIIQMLRKVKVKKEGRLFGREMAIMQLEDGTGTINVTAFPDCYDMIKENLFIGEPLCVTGDVTIDDYANDGSLRMGISKIEDCVTGDIIFEDKRKF